MSENLTSIIGQVMGITVFLLGIVVFAVGFRIILTSPEVKRRIELYYSLKQSKGNGGTNRWDAVVALITKVFEMMSKYDKRTRMGFLMSFIFAPVIWVIGYLMAVGFIFTVSL